MKNALIAAGLLLSALSTAAIAQDAPQKTQAASTAAHTPGYDRPAPGNHEADGKQHVVYWSDFFDRFTFDVQTAADANSADDIKDKPKH